MPKRFPSRLNSLRNQIQSLGTTSPLFRRLSVPSGARFSLGVRLSDTGETFTLPRCHTAVTIRHLKRTLEVASGIPTDFQRLSYLDGGDLMDETTIGGNDIIPGSTVAMSIWPYNGWPELVKAAVCGDLIRLQSAVFKPVPGPSGDREPWHAHRLFSALFISAHRGHGHAVSFLLQNGADPKGQTSQGRGALHAAAAAGRVRCLHTLHAAGAPLWLRDHEGHTASALASLLGQETSAQQLSLLRWRDRAAGIRPAWHLDRAELFAHQRFDSSLRTWHRGARAQRYVAELGGRAGTGRPAGMVKNT